MQDGAQHLEHPGERDLRLAGDAARAQHREVLGAPGGEVQQRRLARARHAAQQHCVAIACSCRVYQRLQPRALEVPPHEHGASLRLAARMWGSM